MKIDKIIRSNRKTFSLEIKPDGQLIVRAPRAASMALIESMVANKEDWITKTKGRLARQYPQIRPKSFIPGETFYYLGEKYPLRLTDRKNPLLDLDGEFLLAKGAQARAKALFIEWYREETRRITDDIVQKYIHQYHFRVNKVRITSARTRWGSCSTKNNLNFTYRLSMAPLDVIDYVVVHELVHLKIRNHSKKFWNNLEAIKPGYKVNRKWLREHGALLTLD
jgi:predicted metal-dependent hydrolase